MPGFLIRGELSTSPTGSTWATVRTSDDHPFALKVLPVTDATAALALAREQIVTMHRNEIKHLVRQHDAIALADGTLALVLDEVTGISLAQVLGARGQLTPGESVTTLAPLFGALAELHSAGVVHGDLTPGAILFSAEGKPLISDLGVARLVGSPACRPEGVSGLVAPELVGAAAPSPASDVYAMAALGWYSLAGAPPAPANVRPSLSTLRPGIPDRLVELLTSCLSTNPTARPCAAAAAAVAFDAAPAEPVDVASASDPAAEITRRIRVAAASGATPSPPPKRKGHRRRLAFVGVALVVSVVTGGAATWLLPDSPADRAGPVVVPAARSLKSAPVVVTPSPALPKVAAPSTAVPTTFASPRTSAAGLLQSLVDARALAYVARDTALLDLAFAPGAAKAGLDRANIATALQNRATYLGLSFVVKDVTFLEGTATTAHVRATIVTPAYETGQPDGRTVSHAQEIVGPSIFSLSLTRDGWRISGLTSPSP